MSDPFIAEIRIVGFNFAPRGWAACDGQLLPIAQNTALFSLLGTNYGGNGVSTFGLPDLQGRSAMQQGQGPGLTPRDLGEMGGSDTVTLIESEMPAHSHSLQLSQGFPDTATPAPNVAPGAFGPKVYGVPTNQVAMNGLASTGAGQPHNNRQPYLAMNFVIALQGVFPARS